MSTLQKIYDYLDAASIVYKKIQHAPTYTSQESADARWESIDIWGKALLIKHGDQYSLFVLSASKKINNDAIKNILSYKKIRFASTEELLDITWLVPGSVPPFGRPIYTYDCYVDRSLLSHDKIAFNAWSLTNSIVMQTQDYIGLTKYQIVDIGL
jgi:prolyl-tRNA editing enzyme YbaK/EbsC (Cys-tRNA(Pro) deacylase)